MTASLAERIRAIAATLTPATVDQATNALLAIAVPVERVERVLDEIAADAMASETAYVEHSLVLDRAREAQRRRASLKVVT